MVAPLNFSRFRLLLAAILLLAGLALVVDRIHFGLGRVRLLTPVAALPHGEERGFRPNGVYTTTSVENLPPNIHTHGSWLDSDESVGEYTSDWYAARPGARILVAGYPSHAGNSIRIEARNASGETSILTFTAGDPRESWETWPLQLADDVTAFRVHAVDNATATGGWIGVTEPFVQRSSLDRVAWPILQLLCTACLCVATLYLPGLVWYYRLPREPGDLCLAALVGPVLMAGVGVICWAGGGLVPPGVIATALLGAIIATLAWYLFFHRGAEREYSPLSSLVVIGLLLGGFAAAKANISVGPDGELFGGTVSRTLAVGGHSDSRISFHLVQVIAQHLSPASAEAKSYFAPWQLTSRGPLAGLIAAPVVLSVGSTVPSTMPDQKWQPFDPEGFAAYRLAMIFLATLSAWIIYGFVFALGSQRAAVLALGVVALAPFYIHEIYFTWPKLYSAALVVCSAYLVRGARPFFSGVVLATAYLFHPLALLSTPVLLCYAYVRPAAGTRAGLFSAARWALGLVAVIVPWQLFARFCANGSSAQQIFFSYFFLADNAPATWPNWLFSRWQNFANTFVPFYLLSGNPAHESINSAYGPSGAAVHRSFLYWNTLPFAVGLPLFLVLLPAFFKILKNRFWPVAIGVLCPAAFLIIYWGAADTGMMRHCGHVIFFSFLIASVLGVPLLTGKTKAVIERLLVHPVFLSVRALDILVMSFGTTLLARIPRTTDLYIENDAISAILAVAFLIGLTSVIWRLSRSPDAITRGTRNALREGGSVTGTRPLWPRVLLLLSCLVILCFRKPGLLVRPQFWAEDGMFYRDAVVDGFHSFLTPYAGYLHFVPRLAAFVSSLFDPGFAPAIFLTFSLAALTYLLLSACSPRSPMKFRYWCALACVLIPEAPEVLLNVVNIQWLLGAALLLKAVSEPPATDASRACDLGAAAVIGLTGPFSILFAPAFVIRAYRRRDVYSRALAGIIGACGAIQLYFVVTTPQTPGVQTHVPWSEYIAVVGQRIAGSLMLGRWSADLSLGFYISFGALFLLLLVALASYRGPAVSLRLVFCAFAFEVGAAVLYRCRGVISQLELPPNGQRYFYLAQLFAVWLILAALQDARPTPRRWLIPLLSVIGLACISMLPGVPLQERSWYYYADSIRRGAPTIVPLNPPGWKIFIAPKQ